jgi:hypothetical protein
MPDFTVDCVGGHLTVRTKPRELGLVAVEHHQPVSLLWPDDVGELIDVLSEAEAQVRRGWGNLFERIGVAR